MKSNLALRALSVVCAWVCLAHAPMRAHAAGCQPPETSVAVYDFVPEAALQTGDFRPLLRTETGFLKALRAAPNLDVSDFTTPVLSPEMQPDPPPMTGELSPPPAQGHEEYFCVGQITKEGDGFSLAVQLKKAATGALLHEEKTPFAEAGAQDAGAGVAKAMLAFFSAQMQSAHANRDGSEYAMDPQLTLQISKLQLKPKEVASVKIILSDCDGVRLKHRKIEAFLLLTSGSAPPESANLVRLTDDKGERSGDIGSNVPGVITYVVKFKYKDAAGAPREKSESRTIVVAGAAPDLWQMRVDLLQERSTRMVHEDAQSGRFLGERYFVRSKASMVFVFRAPLSPEGEAASDEIKSYNGFGETSLRRKNMVSGDSAEYNDATGILDHKPDAAERIQAGFSLSPANHSVQFSVSNIPFRGSEHDINYRAHPYNYAHADKEYIVTIGADGGTKLTPQMTRSGVYAWSHTDKTSLTERDTVGYEQKTFTVELRRVSPAGKGLIKR